MYRSGYRGLDKRGLISWFDGLSIVILRPLTPYQQIVKEICRQIDKPHMPNITDIKVCQGLNNNTVRHYRGRYIEDTNLSLVIDKPYIRDTKVWQI